MAINVDILDQRVRKIAEDFRGVFEELLDISATDEKKQRSTAFVFLAIKTVLDLTDEEAVECLTEGFDDFGIDAMHIGDIDDGEFVVTVAQGKYNNSLRDAAGDVFPEKDGVLRVIPTVQHLFNPYANIPANSLLAKRIEMARSLVRDGYLPKLRVLLCNNGKRWSDAAQASIDNVSAEIGEALSWEHVNHDRIIRLQQSRKPVDERVTLVGDAIIENFNFCRVLVGRIAITELAALFARKGDRLLERNIRRFLGMQGNRVNQAIQQTLLNANECQNFYFYNNGVTIVCNKFTHSGLQPRDMIVQLKGMQVINGGQTCKTIQDTLAAGGQPDSDLTQASVLVRVYELPDESEDLVRSITYATNSQNPVDLRDLRSNDAIQKGLETAMAELGFVYHRYRSEDSARRRACISSARAAEAVLSVWRHRPFQAKYHGREHFGRFYESIFRQGLNAAQCIIAVLIMRVAESKRRRPPDGTPDCVAYGSYFAAMLMGRYLLSDLNISLDQLNHTNFDAAKEKLEAKADEYFDRAINEIDAAVSEHFGGRDVSLQELASVFRGGALMGRLLQ